MIRFSNFFRSLKRALETAQIAAGVLNVPVIVKENLTAEDELADGENLTHGSITIGVSETALNIYLLDRLRAFHMAYPGINLKIYNHSTPQAVDEVKNGSIDFAVVTTPADVEAPLKKIVLQSYREILIGGTTFSSLKKQKLSIAEMRKHIRTSLLKSRRRKTRRRMPRG